MKKIAFSGIKNQKLTTILQGKYYYLYKKLVLNEIKKRASIIRLFFSELRIATAICYRLCLTGPNL